MQYQILTLAAFIAGASARTTLTQLDTVTEQHTTDVTVTSCSDHACATTTINTTSQTTVTTTVNGIETVYTTVCPESTAKESTTKVSSSKVTNSETSLAGVVSTAPGHGPASVSSSDIFVDVTITPTVTSSTNVKATVTKQSTMTSIFNSTVPTIGPIAENNANKKVIGMVGFVGLAAALL